MPSNSVILLLILALAGLSTAQTPSSSSQAPTPISSSSEPTLACGFIGDNNTYGLGIRLGIYLQWITTAIAYNLVHEEADSMRLVNFLFALSNFISLLYVTATQGSDQPSGQLYTVEAWILLSFCFGGIATGSIGVYQPKTATIPVSRRYVAYTGKPSVVSGCFQAFLTIATTFYAVWFLYIGMDRMLYNPCSTYAFFFTRVNIYHWFRTFAKVIFTTEAVIISVLFIIFFIYFVFCLIQSENPLKMISDTKERLLSNPLLTFYFNLALIFFIVETEFVIRWNHIQEVNNISGTGQIIPVVVAGAGLIQVIWKWKPTEVLLGHRRGQGSSTGGKASAEVVDQCLPVVDNSLPPC